MNRKREHAERVKREDAEAKKLEELDRRIKTVMTTMKLSAIPPKRRTKLPYKASPNSFNKSLRGVPGSSRFGLTWSVLQKMADHPETGTRLATGAEKLDQSAQNSYTTKGNYIV